MVMGGPLARIRESFDLFAPCGPAMIARTLERLETDAPGLRALFPEPSERLNKRLFATLRQVVRHAHHWHALEGPLMDLGRRAAAAGANTAHYAIARDALLATMAELAGDAWTPELARDWRFLLDAAAGAMMRGMLGRLPSAA